MRLNWPVILLTSSAAVACGSESRPAAVRCIPGQQFACACPGGGEGVQVCNPQGTFETCSCDEASAATQQGGEDSASDAGGGPEAGASYGGAASGGPRATPSSAPGSTSVVVDAGSGTVIPPIPSVTPDAGATPSGAECSALALRYRPLDAEFSKSLDRIVAVGAAPSALYLLDPHTGESRSVSLPLPPDAVSVSPDGKSAAVAHNAFVSVVDLESVTLSKTYPTTSDAEDVVHGGNGYVYIFPRTDQWVAVHSINLADGKEAQSSAATLRAMSHARRHPSLPAIYTITRDVSPTDITRFDIGGGPVRDAGRDSPYHGDHPMCESLWFTESGDRVFTACGSAFRASPGTTDDLTYAGILGGSATSFWWIAHAEAKGKIYGVPRAPDFSPQPAAPGANDDANVRVYTADFLALESTLPIPCLSTPSGKTAVLGRYVFPSAKGDALFVLGKLPADSGAAADWSVSTIPL
jgi:chitinase